MVLALRNHDERPCHSSWCSPRRPCPGATRPAARSLRGGKGFRSLSSMQSVREDCRTFISLTLAPLSPERPTARSNKSDATHLVWRPGNLRTIQISLPKTQRSHPQNGRRSRTSPGASASAYAPELRGSYPGVHNSSLAAFTAEPLTEARFMTIRQICTSSENNKKILCGHIYPICDSLITK